MADLFEQLLAAVQADRVLCPLFVPNIIETVKRYGPESRRYIAETQAMLSQGYVYRSRAARLGVELRATIQRRLGLVGLALLAVGLLRLRDFDLVRQRGEVHAWFDRFRATMVLIPGVVEFCRMSGDVDYLLRVVVPDIGAYDRVYKRLINDTQQSDISSSFAMDELKYTTALPPSYVD